jgi:hypothetical protein
VRVGVQAAKIRLAEIHVIQPCAVAHLVA